MHIVVEIKNNWGNEHIYPVCALAHKLHKLVGTSKCFTDSHMKAIRDLGYTIGIKVGARELSWA